MRSLVGEWRASWQFIRRRDDLQQILTNFGWLTFQQILCYGIAGVAGIALARSLGPEPLGQLMFVFALVRLASPLAGLGLESVAVRELVKQPQQAGVILGSSALVKLASSLLAMVGLAAYAWLAASNADSSWPTLLAVASLSLPFRALDVPSYWFAARVESRFSVAARSIAVALGALAQFGLILVEAPLLTFAIVFVFEALLEALLLWWAYRRRSPADHHWSASLQHIRALMRDSWPMLVSAAAVTIYMYVDQVMLKVLAGETQVGLYSPAVQICSMANVLAVAASASLFPAVIKLREIGGDLYRRRIQQLYDLATWGALALALAVSLAAPWLVQLLYGEQYQASAAPLAVLIWSTVLIFPGTVQIRWAVAENLQFYTQFATLAACLFNIGANWLLIPRYGALGAAMGTLASYPIAAIIGVAVFKPTRSSVGQLLRAFIAPWFWLRRERTGRIV